MRAGVDGHRTTHLDLDWHAPDSQIYPELRKMAAEELVSAMAWKGRQEIFLLENCSRSSSK